MTSLASSPIWTSFIMCRRDAVVFDDRVEVRRDGTVQFSERHPSSRGEVFFEEIVKSGELTLSVNTQRQLFDLIDREVLTLQSEERKGVGKTSICFFYLDGTNVQRFAFGILKEEADNTLNTDQQAILKFFLILWKDLKSCAYNVGPPS